MSAYQQGMAVGSVNLQQILVIYGRKAQIVEPCQFCVVVHYCSEGVEMSVGVLLQETLRLFDGPYHSSAEAGVFVNIYFHRIGLRPNFSLSRDLIQSICSSKVISVLSSSIASGALERGDASL